MAAATTAPVPISMLETALAMTVLKIKPPFYNTKDFIQHLVSTDLKLLTRLVGESLRQGATVVDSGNPSQLLGDTSSYSEYTKDDLLALKQEVSKEAMETRAKLAVMENAIKVATAAAAQEMENSNTPIENPKSAAAKGRGKGGVSKRGKDVPGSEAWAKKLANSAKLRTEKATVFFKDSAKNIFKDVEFLEMIKTLSEYCQLDAKFEAESFGHIHSSTILHSITRIADLINERMLACIQPAQSTYARQSLIRAHPATPLIGTISTAKSLYIRCFGMINAPLLTETARSNLMVIIARSLARHLKLIDTITHQIHVNCIHLETSNAALGSAVSPTATTTPTPDSTPTVRVPTLVDPRDELVVASRYIILAVPELSPIALITFVKMLRLEVPLSSERSEASFYILKGLEELLQYALGKSGHMEEVVRGSRVEYQCFFDEISKVSKRLAQIAMIPNAMPPEMTLYVFRVVHLLERYLSEATLYNDSIPCALPWWAQSIIDALNND
ncbi:hypothetical protein HDV05_003079 [Chytridiales sp. JEL 0842]|nr:hypothetical protein HDV05_003079 [Chytridiales sp. JEL 0842]